MSPAASGVPGAAAGVAAASARSARLRVRVTVFSAMALRAPLVLRVHRREIESARVLRRVRVRLALVDLEVAHLAPRQRAVLLHHALDRAHDHALGEAALEGRARRLLLDAADMAGVPVEAAVVELAAGQPHLLGVDDDDVVAAVDMRRERRLVLALEPHGDDRREPAEHDPLRIDQQPLLALAGRLGREGCGRLHENALPTRPRGPFKGAEYLQATP